MDRLTRTADIIKSYYNYKQTMDSATFVKDVCAFFDSVKNEELTEADLNLLLFYCNISLKICRINIIQFYMSRVLLVLFLYGEILFQIHFFKIHITPTIYYLSIFFYPYRLKKIAFFIIKFEILYQKPRCSNKIFTPRQIRIIPPAS